MGGHNRINRSTWKSTDDLALMKTILNRADTLHEHYVKSIPTKHFWEIIIQDLSRLENMERNARQCRDRFNILYSKGMRNKIAGRLPSSSNQKVMEIIFLTFHLDEKGQIILKKDFTSKTNRSNMLTQNPDFTSSYSNESLSETNMENKPTPPEFHDDTPGKFIGADINMKNIDPKVSSSGNSDLPGLSRNSSSSTYHSTNQELYQIVSSLSRQVGELNLRINDLICSVNRLQEQAAHQNWNLQTESFRYYPNAKMKENEADLGQPSFLSHPGVEVPSAVHNPQLSLNPHRIQDALETSVSAERLQMPQQHQEEFPGPAQPVRAQGDFLGRDQYSHFPYTWGLYPNEQVASASNHFIDPSKFNPQEQRSNSTPYSVPRQTEVSSKVRSDTSP